MRLTNRGLLVAVLAWIALILVLNALYGANVPSDCP